MIDMSGEQTFFLLRDRSAAENRGRRAAPPLRLSMPACSAEARRLRCCPLHCIAADAGHGLQGVTAANPSGPRSATRRRMPAGSRQPPVQRATAERPWTLRLQPCRNLDRASSMSPLSSTPMLEGSWAGGPRARRMQISCSMRWSRPCMIGSRPMVAGTCTTGGKYVSISTPSAWLKLGDPSVGSVIDPASEALRRSRRPYGWQHKLLYPAKSRTSLAM